MQPQPGDFRVTTVESVGGTFDIGRVARRTFEVIGANFALFTAAAVGLVGVPSLIAILGQSSMATTPSGSGALLWVVGLVLSFIGTYMLQGAIVHVSINTLNGRKTSAGDAISVGAKLFLPLLCLAILMGFGLAIGFILLIVPGIILYVLWVVVAPVLVAEKRRVMQTFQRSRDLTRGHRWSIFALLVVYGIGSAVISFAIQGVGGGAAGAATVIADGAGPGMALLVLTPLSAVVQGVIGSAGVAAIYYELRSAKEGVGPEQLASVFD